MKQMDRLVIMVIAVLAVVFARADEFVSFDWTQLRFSTSPYVTISNGVLTASLPPDKSNETATVQAELDLSQYNARGFEFSIEGWGENVAKPRVNYFGVKFSVSFMDPVGGERHFKDARGLTGSYERQTFSSEDSIPRQGRIKANIRFGLQETSGKASFDLRTLRVRPIEIGVGLVNQDYRVSYPRAVCDMPVLRGAMLPDRPERMDEKTFRDLSAWGATLVRYHMVGFGDYLDGGRPTKDVSIDEELLLYDAWLEKWLDKLEKDILGWARKYGIRLAVNLQALPGGRLTRRRDPSPRGAYDDMRMFYYKEYADHFVDVWKRIATRFKGNEDIIYGYDLVNEPDQKRTALVDYWTLQKRAAEVVRSIDPKTTIIFEANTWDNPEAFAQLSPLAMDNVIYSVHMYRPHEFTHQGLYGAPTGIVYPDHRRGWNKEYLRNRLQAVRDFQLRHGARIFVGEFSAVIWARGADRYLADVIDIFEEYQWDWVYHAFRESDCWSVEHECDAPGKKFVPSSDNPRMRVVKSRIGLSATDADHLRTKGDIRSSVAEPSDETAAIQAQIDAASAGGGGRVTLGKGDHLVGSLWLKTGVELHLTSGARLIGSRNPEDYVLDLSGRGYEERITRRWANAMIRIIGARDVAVTGEPGSEICGRNCYDPKGEEGFRGPHAITAFGVTNLVLRGYQVRDAGNFGLYASNCECVRATDIDVRGGHDGFDFFRSRNVLVEGCRIFSGDDCVAGWGNENLAVRDCEVNTACNFFRLGGVNILIEGCHGEGPGRYPHRWSLTEDEKKMENLPLERGRHNTIGGFTFFTGKSQKATSKNIVVRNCRFGGLMRLIHYNLSGNERWQQGKGLEDLTFENVTATDVEDPLTAYGVPDHSLRLILKDCHISFRHPVPRFVAGAHVGLLDLRGTAAEGVAEGVLMTNWQGPFPRLEMEGSSGFPSKVERATMPFGGQIFQ